LAYLRRRLTQSNLHMKRDDSVALEELRQKRVTKENTDGEDVKDDADEDDDDNDDDDEDDDDDDTDNDDHSDDNREVEYFKAYLNDRSHFLHQWHQSSSSSINSSSSSISSQRRRCHRGSRTAAAVFAMLCVSSFVFVLIHHRHIARRRRPMTDGRSLDGQPSNVIEEDVGNINRELDSGSVSHSHILLGGISAKTTIGVQTYKLAHPYPGVVAVRAESNLSERLRLFNAALEQLRVDLFAELAADDFRRDWHSSSSSSKSPELRRSPTEGAHTAARTAAGDSSRNVSDHARRILRQWNNDQLLIGDSGNGGVIGGQHATAIKNAANVIIVNEDEYLKRLSAEFPLVRILVLPWYRPSSSAGGNNNTLPWDSRTDFANLFVQVSIFHENH